VCVVVTGPAGSGKSTLSMLGVAAMALHPLAGPWLVIEVDTSVTVDVRDVAERVRRTRSRP
jgi:ABC-type lipoprotein export system ATPase subunit